MNTLHLKEIIYQGSYSTVYQADRGDKKIIVKLLNEQFPSPDQIARFNREYDITNRFDVAGSRKALAKEKINERYGLILEYVEGQTLREYIQKQLKKEEKISIRDFLVLAKKITRILANIHSHQIIHKDINPKNILLTPTGDVHIIDFGIAAILHKQAQKENLDVPESLKGTLNYISPEQTGRMNRSLDHRSDLYSLGITLYELLVGKLPFPDEADVLEIIHYHLAQSPPSVKEHRPDIPETLSAIITKLLTKTPEERYQSTHGLLTDLTKCLDASKNGAKSFDFALGEADFSDRLHIPEKLYGRDIERKKLLDLFEVVTKGNSEVMLIAGFSGIGKTALVNEIHKPITLQKGSFVTGKFTQYQKDTPYSAIIEALNDFTEQLLAQSETQTAHWRKVILTAVGTNGQVLIDVVPNLEHLLGKQSPVPELPPIETQNRFRGVFQSFIRVVSTKNHPLVIFLDDWQWADLASIDLLTLLAIDSKNKYLFLICAYRDNEVNKLHPFVLGLDKIRQTEKELHHIKLESLSFEDVNILVAESLNTDTDKTNSLTKLLIKKTKGNPFFLTQLFSSLYEDGHIQYKQEKQAWTWDMFHIAKLEVTGNVVDLMVNKIEKLPFHTQVILQTAACIGNKFPLKTLSFLLEKTQKEALTLMWEALEEGLLINIAGDPYTIEDNTTDSNVYFKFFHDRVEQAAYSMISEVVKKETQLRIGRHILTEETNAYVEEFLFEVVNYMNGAVELITEGTERLNLAQLNIRASKKAKKATAYQAAEYYCQVAADLLGDTKWEDEYQLSIDLYSQWGEVLFLTANNTKSDSILEEGLKYAQSNIDKSKFYLIKINRNTMESKYIEASQIMLEVVALFGMHLPAIEDTEAVEKETAKELEQFFKYVETRDIQTFRHLKPIEDAEMKIAVDIMCQGVGSIFMGVPHYFAYYMTKIMNTTASYGLSPYAGPGYSFFAIVLSSLGRYSDAYDITDIAHKLIIEDDLVVTADVGRVLVMKSYMLVLHDSYEKSLICFMDGYQNSVSVGDLMYAAYCIVIHARYSVTLGLDLALGNATEAGVFLDETGNIAMKLFVSKVFGFARNLRGETTSLTSFDCEEFNEEGFLNAFGEAAPVLAAMFIRYKMWAFVLYELYDEVFLYIDERNKWLRTSGAEAIDLMVKADYNLYMVLAITGKYHELSTAQKEKYTPVIEQSLTDLKVLAEEHSPENFGAYYQLMLAENARIEGRIDDAITALNKAKKHAQQAKFLCLEALVNEFLGKIYLELEDTDIASIYLHRSKHLYQLWGATQKVNLLTEKYPQLFAVKSREKVRRTRGDFTHHTQETTYYTTASTRGGQNNLDFESVIKATQALSGEVKLDALLEKMLGIVLENAGAQRGLILQVEEAKLLVLADQKAQTQVDLIKTSENLEKILPLSLIRYVLNTQQTIILNDASKNKITTNDTYVLKNGLKSALCLPILKQGKVSLVIYLENKLTGNAFTPAHLGTLKLLTGQIAVSFENALLYDNMEQAVAVQTTEIQDKSQRITDSIRYAQNIQNAILPSDEFLAELYAEHFVMYLPKDIVSGDFYWARKTEKYIFTAVVDCTGHGVPGAFMSMIGKTLLDEILNVKGINDPAMMLNKLHEGIAISLRQQETENNDGMDVVLIRLEYLDNGEIELVFAGAKRPLYIIQGTEFTELKANRKSIGGMNWIKRAYINQEIRVKSGTMLYLSSDGIGDTVSPERKRLGTKRVRELIHQYAVSSLAKQKTMLEQAITTFEDGSEQRDDVTLIGLKLK
jgi:predicted ATPase/serine phosphatase RsbU (regulator of sigma subunit)/tRNA A-37 threonylcarbamoyl transferase component Bud32